MGEQSVILEVHKLDDAKILKHLKANGEPGKSTGFTFLDPDPVNRTKPYYTIKKGGVTDWTGFPQAGKTNLVLELCVTQAEKFSKRTGLYVPDLGNYEEVMEKLFKMVSGKDFMDRYGNKISEEEIHKHKDWINHHFLIFRKADIKRPVDPISLFLFAATYEDDAGGIDMLLVDCWGSLFHDLNGKQEHQYLDYVLSYRNEIADQYQKHFHTIAHPVKTELEENPEGRKRRVPTAYDIKGGSAWFSHGKNIITVDRPNKFSTEVDLLISKAKPEGVGNAGMIVSKLRLDLNRGRYKEILPDGSERFTFDKINPIPF